MMTTTTAGPVDPIGADLHRTLKQLKLGQMTQTLPERLILARHQKMSHAAFLELILGDEISRRESRSAMLRGCVAHPRLARTLQGTASWNWRNFSMAATSDDDVLGRLNWCASPPPCSDESRGRLFVAGRLSGKSADDESSHPPELIGYPGM